MARMTLKQNWSRSMEVLGAYWRQGLKELGSLTYGAGTAAQSPEYGMAATKLPSEIAKDMEGKPTAIDHDRHTAQPDTSAPQPASHSSILERYQEDARTQAQAQAPQERGVHSPDPIEPERE